MALEPFCWALPLLQFRNLLYTDGRTPRMGISPSQGRYLHAGQHKHRINVHTDIHALSGIRNHDPGVRASEDSSCLRPRGHCDRQFKIVEFRIIYLVWIHYGECLESESTPNEVTNRTRRETGR
jgi:hypothetical protein